ncbi:nucleic acid/nucleotide deaminase domain-containing protein [Actinomadura sp. KC06]|uniref:nucleic acid/nucleotide deaminase domain-containing protein n=1 Tax=Actinomadura sp. KC06 TaxID=2530369 RepID=UPI00140473A9|nr:nucleic acid/nucleotide deaminase domain-containing protein [Actinomadura sp. KC06]
MTDATMARFGPEIMARFGPEGVRRIPSSELPGADAGGVMMPADAARALADPGLPLQVGPYFTASTGEPLALAEYAATIGYPDAVPNGAPETTLGLPPNTGPADGPGAEPGTTSGTAGWCRIGTDQGAEICVTGAGDVQAVFVTATATPMVVNGSVPAFVGSLLALDRYLPLLASPGDRNPAEIFRELRRSLLEIDEPALADDEAWWPRVLEQIRHALSFPFAAAIEYEEAGGGKHVETEQARVGLPHPERLLWDRLDARGIAPGQVTRVYTELEPCFLPGNYCRLRLSRFRNAEFTYSFDYGATADERERGLLELMQQAAQET